MDSIEERRSLAKTMESIHKKQIQVIDEEKLRTEEEKNELKQSIENLQMRMDAKKDPSILKTPAMIESCVKGLDVFAVMQAQILMAGLVLEDISLIGFLMCFGYSAGIGLTNYMYARKIIKEQLNNTNLAKLDFFMKKREDELDELDSQIIVGEEVRKSIVEKLNTVRLELESLESEKTLFVDSEISKDNIKTFNKN